MPKPPDNWPPGLLPRCLDCGQAAYYVGLCQTTFLKAVKEGRYPQPRPEGRRTIWDKTELDAALDRLAGRQAKIAADPGDDDEAVAVMLRRVSRR